MPEWPIAKVKATGQYGRMSEEPKKTHQVYLGLGSNLGDRLGSLRKACQALSPYVTVTARSSVYETVAAYATDQPLFLNAVVAGTTTLDPMGLLYTLKDLEIELGRRPTFRFGPRVIDLDILSYDQVECRSSELTIPHIALHERLFVLRPLVEIAPEWMHPTLGKTAQQLLDELNLGDVSTLVGSLTPPTPLP